MPFPIVSMGEIPQWMNEESIPNYVFKIGKRQRTASFSNNSNYKTIYRELVSTGFVIFGNHDFEFLNSIAHKITSKNNLNEVSIYPYRSTLIRTFNDGKNKIFVTTGLIAKAKSPEELLFFIAREIYKLQSPHKSIPVGYVVISRYNDMLEFLTRESESAELAYDLGAIDYIKNAGYNTYSSIDALKLVLNAELPFGEAKFDVNYFNEPLLYVPYELFKVERSAGNTDDRPAYLQEREKKVKNRIQAISSYLINGESLESDLKDKFEIARFDCKIEQIRLQILENNYFQSIYEIYLLELAGVDSGITHPLKAMTWLGIVDQEYGSVTARKSRPYFGGEHASSELFIFLNLLNSDALVTLALREIGKLHDLHSNDDEYAIIKNKMVQILNSAKHFSIDKFYPDLYSSAFDSSKYVNVFANEFYLFGLSDYVKNNTFKDSTTTTKENITPDVIKTCFNKYSRKAYDVKKSDRLRKKMQAYEQLSTLSSIDNYNQWMKFALIAYQSNNGNGYRSAFLPLDFTLDGQSEEINLFEGGYNLKVKPTYFVFLTVVGLGYVLPDFFLSANDSWHTRFVINGVDGEVVKMNQYFYHDPLNKYLIQNRIEKL